ncbi:MFS transporter [Spongisporangium articulatum]|uniref:MFS transporter n=1 Tax=Spongisporangium articulatum TaxID=3362603 RepID=A0ABW8AJK0_9ACTN
MTAVVDNPVPVIDRPAGPDPAPSDAAAPPTGAVRWLGFGVVMTAMIMNILDGTILNVAAPSIQRDLGTSSSALEWIVAAYTLAIAVGLLTGGRLGDIHGRKPMLLIGLAGFVAASIGCALAPTAGALIAGRAVQGLAAALLVPQAFGLIRDLFGPQDIGKAFAAFGPVIGLSTVAGPVVAGLLMKFDPFGAEWRSLFLINVPFGLAALVVGARLLPNRAPRATDLRLDGLGTVLVAATSFLMIYPLVEGREKGWPAWIFGILLAAVPALAAFVLQQRRRVASGRSGLVEFSVLRKRSYVSGVVFTLMFFGSVVGFGLSAGLFLQVGAGLSPLRAALYLTSLMAGAFFGSGIGAWAVNAVGRPILHVGLGLMGVGLAVLLVSLHRLEATSVVHYVDLAPGLAVYGFGMGMIFVPLFSIIMGEIEDHEVGSAAGLLEVLQQLGASLGVAVLATLFFSRFALEDGGPQAAVAAGRHLAAAQATVLVSLVLLSVAFALGFLLPRRARMMEM